MKKPIKFGFIGCGGHSGRHADVVAKMPNDFKIVGAYDIDTEVARAFISKYNRAGLATTDLTEFFGIPELEAVLIGTPHQFHLELCKEALKAKKHMLCEKPLWEGPHEAEGRKVITETIDKGLVFSSCHLRRFEKEFMHVKDKLPHLIKRFGKALEIHFQFFYHEPSTSWKMSDSLLLDHMNHEIDLVHFLFGHAPAQFWRLSHGFDEYRVAGKTDHGLAIWFSGYRRLKTHIFRNELEIVFETGRVRVEVVLDSLTGIVNSAIKTVSFEDSAEEVVQFPDHPYDDSLSGVMKNFAAAIRGEAPCYLTPQDMITNTAICNDLVANESGSI